MRLPAAGCLWGAPPWSWEKPGPAKPFFSLQWLVDGAVEWKEPGLFVAFEENSRQIVANAATFGWDLPELEQNKLFFLDARARPEQVNARDFTLGGMLAGIEVMAKQLGARRIVFDSLDILLSMLDNPAAEQRELFRLHDWLLAGGLTSLITLKSEPEHPVAEDRFCFLKYMVDCVVRLDHRMAGPVSWRGLRVVKYRGSGFAENEFPLVISERGLVVGSLREAEPARAASTRRVSSGIAALNEMLSGGYFRGSNVLITGSPGTAKSTLAGAFAAAACQRKERTLYFTLEESPSEILRNLASVGIRLEAHVKSRRLRLCAATAREGNADVFLMRLDQLLREHQPRCVIIDPLSTLLKGAEPGGAQRFARRLVRLTKGAGITLLCTAMLDSSEDQAATAALGISTLADTWIHLFYLVQSGERNRALSVIKARGIKHSNQFRELVLTDRGVTLSEVYAVNGDVLLGTLRSQRELDEEAERRQIHAEVELKRREIELAREELAARVAALTRELKMKQTELDYLLRTDVPGDRR